MAIDMLSTGYDISSHVKGCEFNLGIVFRKLSDKTSNPLSGNPFNNLYSEESAKMIQSISRLRKGGIFLVPKSFGDISCLYDIQRKVSMIIKEGYKEVDKISPLRNNPVETYFQTILLAILQNFRYESKERKAIEKTIDALEDIHNRNLKEESERSNFDKHFWLVAIRDYVESEMEDKVVAPTSIPKFKEKATSIQASSHSVEQTTPAIIVEEPVEPMDIVVKVQEQVKKNIHGTGGGEGQTRIIDERIKEAVKVRANGRCATCGGKFWPGEDTQISHIRRFDDGGSYTDDNLVFTHRECDAAYDSGKIILDVNGDFWIHDRFENFTLDKNQYKHISKENIQARWTWEKNTNKWPKILTDAELTDDEFRKLLEKRGYQHDFWA
jgi:hypothetical protein